MTLKTVQQFSQDNPAFPTLEPKAYSVPHFCKAHQISVAHFYRMLKTGHGPKIMHVGVRTLISEEEAAAWRMRMETDTATEGQ